jgi:hypothetical protein
MNLGCQDFFLKQKDSDKYDINMLPKAKFTQPKASNQNYKLVVARTKQFNIPEYNIQLPLVVS